MCFVCVLCACVHSCKSFTKLLSAAGLTIDHQIRHITGTALKLDRTNQHLLIL